MSANLIVGKDPDGNKVPVAVDATGQLKIVGGGGGGGSTDMTTANAQLTAINSNTDGLEGKADTGNALLTTTAADTAIIKDEAILIDAKLPALSAGRIPVVADTSTITATYGPTVGVIPVNTILIGPLNVSQFRTMSVQVTSLGTSAAITAEISNDSTIWSNISGQSAVAPTFPSTLTVGGMFYYQLFGANFFRLRLSTATTGGTTTLFVQGVREVYPQNFQSVTGTISLAAGTLTIPAPSNSAGFPNYHTLISAASTNATSVKASGGCIGTCLLTNTSAAFRFVKIFNLGVAPTMGTSTPVLNFPIPPNSTLNVSTAFAGLRLSSGIAYAITGGSALLDTTAVGAGDVVVNMSFI